VLVDSRSLQNLGRLAQALGRYTEANELLESAMQVAATHGYASLAAGGSFGIGDTELMQHHYIAAERFYQDALKEYQGIKDGDGVVNCWEMLGDVETYRGDLSEVSIFRMH
jgi:tetratricopeptide (TPR) repeat protein